MRNGILAQAIVALALVAPMAFAIELPLDRLKLPVGFSIAVYAEVPNARQMSMSDNGILYVDSMRAGKVHAVIDTDGDFKADNVKEIATGLTLPSGVSWHEGDLFAGIHGVTTSARNAVGARLRLNLPQPLK